MIAPSICNGKKWIQSCFWKDYLPRSLESEEYTCTCLIVTEMTSTVIGVNSRDERAFFAEIKTKNINWQAIKNS